MKKSIKALVGIVAVAGVVALAGCSNGGGGSNSNAITDPAAIAAGEAILPLQQPVDTFTPPGPAIANVASLKGKKVYFIPATMQVPIFSIIQGGLKASFGAAGIEVVTCDAKVNPQDLATCLGQAVDAKAGAVIVGSLPYDLAPNAFDAVTAAKIPIVMGLFGQALPNWSPAFSDASKVAYVTPNFFQMASMNAMAVINNSNAQAHVLVVVAKDTPATEAWMTGGAIPTYAKACPKCKVTTIETTTNELDKLPSLISAKLVADESINYIQSDFDSLTQKIQEGIKSAGRDNVKIVSMDAYLDVLQGMKANGQVIADFGYNLFASSWYMADQAFRLMTGGKAIENEQFPFQRMFTPANVGTLDLTAKGQESGLWYGKADYMGGFAKLWGLAG